MLGDKPTSINSDILFCGVFEESNVGADAEDKEVCDVFNVVSNKLMSTFFCKQKHNYSMNQKETQIIKTGRLTLA